MLPPLPDCQGERLPIPKTQSLHRSTLTPATPLPPIPTLASSQDGSAHFTAPPAHDSVQLPSYYEASQTSAHPSRPMSRQNSAIAEGVTVSPGYAYAIGDGAVMVEMSQEEIHVLAMEGTSAPQMRTLALQYGVDYKDTLGRTPLMYAVLGNQPKMCDTLIKLKATVNIMDQSGVTPLLWATFHARPDIMKLLLK